MQEDTRKEFTCIVCGATQKWHELPAPDGWWYNRYEWRWSTSRHSYEGYLIEPEERKEIVCSITCRDRRARLHATVLYSANASRCAGAHVLCVADLPAVLTYTALEELGFTEEEADTVIKCYENTQYDVRDWTRAGYSVEDYAVAVDVDDDADQLTLASGWKSSLL